MSLLKDPEIIELLILDKELVKIASNFKILTLIEWPKNIQEDFLANYKSGNKAIPKVEYVKRNHFDALVKLEAIINATQKDHPIAQYLNATAKSYWLANKMIENLGQTDMLKYSIEIYGQPSDTVVGSKYTNLDAANFFVEITDQFNEYHNMKDADVCILADTIRAQLEEETRKVITDDEVKFFVDDKLVPKAAAGRERVRLRSGTCFSPYDFKQLLEHEVFVHTLTAINGYRQPHLNSLSLGSPRTTGTQEGLATFAELITGAIDLSRLKRIAQRVIAADMAIKGANFIEIFEYFRANGQSDSESYSSAQRLFRGGDPNGKIIFTKDTVYLDGLLHAHSFFRWAMKNGKLGLSHVLFSGRLTFDDAEKLAPMMEAGVILPPKYLPPWLSQVPTLGGYLAFSLFANKIRVGGLDKQFNQSDS
jgi:uncharacterized protein (TIGR02421 family)